MQRLRAQLTPDTACDSASVHAQIAGFECWPIVPAASVQAAVRQSDRFLGFPLGAFAWCQKNHRHVFKAARLQLSRVPLAAEQGERKTKINKSMKNERNKDIQEERTEETKKEIKTERRNERTI